MSDSFDPEKHFLNRSNNGLIQVISIETGEIVKILKDLDKPPTALVPVTRSDGQEIFVSEGIHPSAIDSCLGAKRFIFSWELAHVICNEIRLGAMITRIHEKGLPSYSYLSAWRKHNEKFDEMIKQAEKDRADEFFARAMEEAMLIKDPEDVAIHRLRHEINKWGAQVGNSEKFGPKSQVQHEQGPLRVILDTGIRRNVSDENQLEDATPKPKLVGSSQD